MHGPHETSQLSFGLTITGRRRLICMTGPHPAICAWKSVANWEAIYALEKRKSMAFVRHSYHRGDGRHGEPGTVFRRASARQCNLHSRVTPDPTRGTGSHVEGERQ